MPSANHDDNAYAAVYLGLSAVPKIVKVTPQWLDMVALEEEACVRRSLNVLAGPGTDMKRINRIVKETFDGVHARACVVLYTGRGEKGSKPQDRETNRRTTRICRRRSRCENISTMRKRQHVHI